MTGRRTHPQPNRVEVVTEIDAPVERCFDLSLSVDLHVASARATGERAVAGVTSGVMKFGESVTWRARHFGLPFELTSRITRFERPVYFQDRMVDGPFASFEHDHFFERVGDRTRMRDDLRFAAPLGAIGNFAAGRLLRRHLERFLVERNRVIKETAEDPEAWKRYLTDA